MTTWTPKDITIYGVRLRYYRTGGAGRPLVLVHGLTDHSLYWSALARALADEHDVIMYDSRGHGASDPSPDGYALTTLAADLAALVRALKLDRPAVIGHSMGGSTAALAAAENPGLFRAVALEDPVWGGGAGGSVDMEAVRAQWEAQLLGRKGRDRAALLAEVRGESPNWSAEDYELWVDSKLAALPAALAVLPTFVRDWPADARRIDCPLLVLTGEPERGAIVDQRSEQAILAAKPDAKVVRLSGAGHQVRRERFDAYLAEVRRFLAQ
jgi:pimeloyl-ACP methyl ester carboxylesterase